MISLGLELTFLPNPRRGPKEWRSKEKAIKMRVRFNRELRRRLRKPRIPKEEKIKFHAKVDVFRTATTGGPAWCLEVNGTPMIAESISDQECNGYSVIEAVYATARAVGVYPFISETKRDGTIVEYPTGGGHIHLATNVWPDGPDNLLKLYALERRLCLDYVNYPFIRWLFCQWLDDHNSHLVREIWRKDLEARWKAKPESEGVIRDAHEQALSCSSISQRFSDYSCLKNHYPTWELRFFDMPRTAKDMALQAGFVKAWVNYHVGKIEGIETNKPPTYTLTEKYFQRLFKDARFARKECEAFFTKIGLKFDDYVEMSWERNYVKRMKFGQPL